MLDSKIELNLKNKDEVIIADINYNNKKYVQSAELTDKGLIYRYYEINNEELIEVEDSEIIDSFRNLYEYKSNEEVYY